MLEFYSLNSFSINNYYKNLETKTKYTHFFHLVNLVNEYFHFRLYIETWKQIFPSVFCPLKWKIGTSRMAQYLKVLATNTWQSEFGAQVPHGRENQLKQAALRPPQVHCRTNTLWNQEMQTFHGKQDYLLQGAVMAELATTLCAVLSLVQGT